MNLSHLKFETPVSVVRAVALLFLSFLMGTSLWAQPLYHPNGAAGIQTSGSSNMGIGISSPSALFDMNVLSNNSAPAILRLTQPYLYQTVQNSPGSVFEVRRGTSTSGIYDYHIFTDVRGRTGFGTNQPFGLVDINGGATPVDALWVKSNENTADQGGIIHYQVKPLPTGEGVSYGWQQVAQNTLSGSGTMEFHYVDQEDPSIKKTENVMVIKSLERTEKNSGQIGINTVPTSTSLDINGIDLINLKRTFDSDGTPSDGSGSGFIGSEIKMGITQSGGPKGLRIHATEDSWDNTDHDAIFIANDGRVAMGTMSPATDAQLSVKGLIECEELEVQLFVDWPDYVFQQNYELRSLADLKSYVKENNHLPGVPSAKEIDEEGLNVGEINAALLEKIEELTLYLFELDEKNSALQKDLETLKKSR